jgi:hypothetical protein
MPPTVPHAEGLRQHGGPVLPSAATRPVACGVLVVPFVRLRRRRVGPLRVSLPPAVGSARRLPMAHRMPVYQSPCHHGSRNQPPRTGPQAANHLGGALAATHRACCVCGRWRLP